MSEQTKSLESAIRKKIDLILINLKWDTDESSKTCNVFTERAKTGEQKKKLKGRKPDYLLYESGTDNILAVIEAKKPDESMEKALKQAINYYAKPLDIPIVIVTDGTLLRTFHIKNNSELKIDGISLSNLLNEDDLKKFYFNSEISSPVEVKYTKQEIIKIFARANELLRKDGLREGVERFIEFANLLFMKMISEIEDRREKEGLPRRFEKKYCWDYFKNWDGERIMDYINDTILPKLVGKYNHSGEVFQKELKIKNPDTIKEIVDKLSNLNLSNIESDVKGDAFEYFLKESVSVGNDLGEYFTPRHIVKLMVQLVDPKFGDKIYDPCCGTGGFLIEAYKSLWNKCKHTKENIEKLQEETIYGRELTETAKIAKMNMILAGDGHTNIVQMDSLSKPVNEKYEAVLTNFPFSQKTDYGSLYGFNTNDANPIFIKHIIDSLTDEGVAGVVTFQGVLYDNKDIYKKIREYLLKNCEVKAIIKLHNYVFQPYTGVNTSIIIFKKGKPTKKVWFFDVQEDGFEKKTSKRGRKPIDKNDIKLLEDIWDTKEDTEKSWTVSIDAIEKNNYNLNAETYKPKKIEKSKTNLVPILNVVDLIKGTVKPFDGEMNYLKTGNLKKDKIIELEKVTFNNKPSRANLLVGVNDIIFAKMKDSNKSLLISDKTKDLIVSTGFMVLRSKDCEALNPEFLKYVVSSKKFLEQKNRFAHGSTQKAINEIDDLKKLMIPLPSIDVQRTIIEKLNKHKAILDKAYEMEECLFDSGIDDTYFDDGTEKSLKDIVIYDQYGTSEKADSTKDDGIPILRMNNISYEGELDLKDLKYIKLSELEKKKYILKEGDILFNRTNSQELVGKTTIFYNKEDFVFASYLIRIRVNESEAVPKYVSYYLNSNRMKKKLLGMAKPSVNMSNINAKELLSIQIRLPSPERQKEIVSILDSQFEALKNIRSLKSNSEEIIQQIIDSLW